MDVYRPMWEYLAGLGQTIRVMDVGARDGDLLRAIRGTGLELELVTVGVDPIRTPGSARYDYYHRVAVDDVSEATTAALHLYSEPGCNSLARMRDVVTHDPRRRGELWYASWEIERSMGEVTVPVMPLREIMEWHGAALWHFVKVDTQGTDLRVVRSIGPDLLARTMFIQIESAMVERNRVLYEGQTTMEEDVEAMAEMGFRVLHVLDYRERGWSPEADITFYNAALYTP